MTATLDTAAAAAPPPTAPTRQLATLESTDVLWDTAGFEHAQRVARLFAASPFVPEHLRGKKSKNPKEAEEQHIATVANCTIALLMAKRMNEDPLVVMQSMYMVSGKPGWSSQYLIARANRSGVFRGRIGWKVKRLTPERLTFKRKVKIGWENGPIYEEREASMPNLSVTARAIVADTNEPVEYEVTSGMAVEEGWSDNAKYSTLGELMLRYRSAAFLVRLYAPDVMLGGSTTVEELEDVSAARGGGAIETTAEVLPVASSAPAAPTWSLTKERLGELRRIEGAKGIPNDAQMRIVEIATGRMGLSLWTPGIEGAITTEQQFDAVRAALTLWRHEPAAQPVPAPTPAAATPQPAATKPPAPAPAPARDPGEDLDFDEETDIRRS